MEIKKPNSMDECLYFTNRSIKDGFATAWVYRPLCESCNKGRMGKPIKKNGKPDKKSPMYECAECKAQVTNEVMDAEYSLVMPQARNRMIVSKGLFTYLIKEKFQLKK